MTFHYDKEHDLLVYTESILTVSFPVSEVLRAIPEERIDSHIATR